MMPPLHIGPVNGVRVRFFQSPINDGRADLPWLAWDDLLAAFPLPEAMRTGFRQQLRSDWPDAARTVATAEGLAVLVPHFAGQGFVAGMAECLGIDADTDYHLAMSAAMSAQTQNLPWPDGVLAYAKAALARWADEGAEA
jgi:hypothetical protein